MITFEDYLMTEFTEEERKEIEKGTQELLLSIQLEQMRKARRVSQKTLAETLRVSQPAIAKMEKEKDMKISTLRRIAEGMGGTLKIEVEFPEGVSYALTR